MDATDDSKGPGALERTRRGWRVGRLMGAVALVALGLGIYQLSKRWADDWAFDRREAATHHHEARFYAGVQKDIEATLAEHPDGGGKFWIIHGLFYRVNPDLKRYVAAMAAYHDREGRRHDWAVGRKLAYVMPTAPPEAPPHLPPAEAEAEYNRRFGDKK